MSQLTGLPQLYGIDPFDTSTIQSHPFGAVGFDNIGRKYRYARAGGVALIKGHLLQSPARDIQFTRMAVQASAAINAKSIKVTLGTTATTANLFDQGFLVVAASTGLGQNFTIEGHGVTAASGTETFAINEQVLTALTTTSVVTATRNPYAAVIDSPTTRTGQSVGVSLTATAISAYTWIGVEGLFGVLSDSTVSALGEDVSPSTTTAGSVTKQVTLLENIGSTSILGVSAEYSLVNFKLP